MDSKKKDLSNIYIILIVSYIAVWECAAWSSPPDGVQKGVNRGSTRDSIPMQPSIDIYTRCRLRRCCPLERYVNAAAILGRGKPVYLLH